jgi:hypothetical protein
MGAFNRENDLQETYNVLDAEASLDFIEQIRGLLHQQRGIHEVSTTEETSATDE